jgi:hypothetical protein
LGVVLGRVPRVVFGMNSVTMSDMGVVGRFLMIAVFMVLGCLMMVLGSMFVVFGCLLMVFGSWMTCHLVLLRKMKLSQFYARIQDAGFAACRRSTYHSEITI